MSDWKLDPPIALANSASRSVRDDVRRMEELRLGAISMERESRECMSPPRLEIAPSSVALVLVNVRVSVPVPSDVVEPPDGENRLVVRSVKSGSSGRSGIVSKGGTNVVDAEPEPDPELLILMIDRIVRIEPVGDPACERSGSVTERSRASLLTH